MPAIRTISEKSNIHIGEKIQKSQKWGQTGKTALQKDGYNKDRAEYFGTNRRAAGSKEIRRKRKSLLVSNYCFVISATRCRQVQTLKFYPNKWKLENMFSYS